MTRSDFLGFGVMGAIMGAILTIPPVAFVLSPIIKTDVLGESDVGSGWVEVASVADVGVEEPAHFKVEFPLQQTYGERAVQKEFPNSQKSNMKYTLTNAIWLSWRAEVRENGKLYVRHAFDIEPGLDKQQPYVV